MAVKNLPKSCYKVVLLPGDEPCNGPLGSSVTGEMIGFSSHHDKMIEFANCL